MITGRVVHAKSGVTAGWWSRIVETGAQCSTVATPERGGKKQAGADAVVGLGRVGRTMCTAPAAREGGVSCCSISLSGSGSGSGGRT
jgi:hypothetical protein